MAGSSSGKAAYWTGALTGLLCSVALVAVLSVLGDRSAPDSAGGQVETAAAPRPAPEPENDTAAQGGQAPDPAPAPTQSAAPEPEPEIAPEPEPLQSAEAPAPVPAPEVEPVVESGDEPEVEADAPPADTAAAEASGISGDGALVEHSEFFNGDPSEPVLAIILVGAGPDGGVTDDVFLLPAPLTLAIDPALANASNLVIDARDSGFEALAILNSSPGNDQDEAAANVVNQLSRVEGVIGVAALNDALSGNGAINGVLTAIAPRGMGLFDATEEGGSTGFRTAKGMGLPAAPLGRAFDETPSSAMVFQSLERAAFDARRTGAFIVVGKAEPSVLTGLRRWLNVKAGKSVAVAPLSEVFRRMRNR